MAVTERPERHGLGDLGSTTRSSRTGSGAPSSVPWYPNPAQPDARRRDQRSSCTCTPTRIHRTHVKITHTFCLVGCFLLLFLGLTISGVLLMFYYVPPVDRAIQGEVARRPDRCPLRPADAQHAPVGWPPGMVLTVLMHMMRVFYTGAYKPRASSTGWWVVVLWVLTLLLSLHRVPAPLDRARHLGHHRRHEHGGFCADLGEPRAAFVLVGWVPGRLRTP